MEVLPAIDLLGGEAVRLVQGDFSRPRSFGDAVAIARSYAEGGARWLHVVDLDGARRGEPAEAGLVTALLAALGPFGTSVQLGGGVRSAGRAEELLAAGVARVVLGTAALTEPQMLAGLARAHPGRVAVALDHRRHDDGRRVLAVSGWEEESPLELAEALGRLAPLPLGAVVVTDIGRDGTLAGPDLAAYHELLELSALPLVASGGIGSLEDLAALAALRADGRRLAGAVVGTALLDGRIPLSAALDCGRH